MANELKAHNDAKEKGAESIGNLKTENLGAKLATESWGGKLEMNSAMKNTADKVLPPFGLTSDTPLAGGKQIGDGGKDAPWGTGKYLGEGVRQLGAGGKDVPLADGKPVVGGGRDDWGTGKYLGEFSQNPLFKHGHNSDGKPLSNNQDAPLVGNPFGGREKPFGIPLSDMQNKPVDWNKPITELKHNHDYRDFLKSAER
ncbi:MAG TPA: hypothetical protein V6C76_06380 [Drouetiella sp.]